MEQYPVPQFIEREARIAFFISFRQLIYLIIAGVICFILYYVLPFSLFIIAAFAIVGGTAALAFLKINGIPLSDYLMSSLGFLVGAKHYTWKKKESLYPFRRISVRKAPSSEAQEETVPLKMGKGSQLKERKTQVEFKTK